MTNRAAASVVIVSQGRRRHLGACLQSLRSQTHRNFEVIVVADALPAGFETAVRYIPFSAQNISAARNRGIASAAGEFVAFLDDDAIPDPPWLERLLAPFDDPRVASSGGFTRGRNGISRQWGAMRFDRSGEDRPFDMDETAAFTIFAADADNPVKLNGTNMAFRTAALRRVGGFDEGFRFFLEDADIKIRLDTQGWKCALVPAAQVHHVFAESTRRQADRTPADLFEIGASKALFCRKHLDADTAPHLDAFAAHQRVRLRGFRRLGRDDRDALLDGLERGFADGAIRQSGFPVLPPPPEFNRFAVVDGPHVVLCARARDERLARRTASELVARGCRVSILRIERSPRFFRVRFVDGYWCHAGGLFGRSVRSQPLLRFASYKRRFADEAYRIAKLCDIDWVAYTEAGDFTPELSCLAPLAGRKVNPYVSVK